MGTNRFSVLLFILILINPLYAKEYDLQSILSLAEKNNKQIKLSQSDLKMAKALKKEAFSTALPKLNVDLGYNRNFRENFFFISVEDSFGNKQTNKLSVSFKNEYQLNATLSQTLYSFGKVGSAIQAASYYKKYTDYQYDLQWQGVIIQVKKVFYQVLLTQKVWEVTKQSEQSALDNYNNIKTKYDSGVKSEYELLQAEVRWQNSISETMKTHQTYKLAINNLKALVEIPLNEEITLKGKFDSYPVYPDSIDMTQVFENRPDYNALLWEKKLNEKRVTIEFSNHLPSLNGNMIYTYGARSDDFKIQNDNDNIIMGLSLNIPLFSGGYTSAQVQKAKVNLEKVNTRIEVAIDNIEIEMKNVYLKLSEAQQRILAARKNITSATRAFEIAESRVEHGLATQLELKDSRIFLDRAKLNYYIATYDYLNAYFDWEFLTGNVH